MTRTGLGSILPSVSDPDPDWIRIQSGLWIRIWIRIGNPDLDPDPGARKVAKIKIKNNFFFYIFTSFIVKVFKFDTFFNFFQIHVRYGHFN